MTGERGSSPERDVVAWVRPPGCSSSPGRSSRARRTRTRRPWASPGAGIGFPHTFAIGVVAADGTAEPADAEAGVEWLVEGAGTLVPGRSVSTVVQVFNNTPTLDADTVLEVVARGGDGALAEGIPNITPHLRLSAQDQDGVVLFSDVPWEQARGSVGRLVARGSDPLAAGEPYTTGPAGSERQITLTI